MLESGPYLDPRITKLEIADDDGIARYPSNPAARGAGRRFARLVPNTRRRWRSELGIGGTRPLSLHVGRLTLLLTVVTLTTVAAVCANVWIATSRRAHDSASAALHFVRSRLSEIELEMRRVGDAANEDKNWASSTLRDVVVRAEVDRNIVRGRMIGTRFVAAVVTIILTLGLIAFIWHRVLPHARLSHRLQRGLRKREFEPFGQRILDRRSGRCAGSEVLMRWPHPQRGILPPSEFIEEADRTGLISGIPDLVMTRAAHRLAPISNAHPDIYFAFNLTPQELAHPPLQTRLTEIFRADTIPHDRILLEVTEREFVDPVAEHSLRALYAAGWRVAVDDFGTGHSSLAALERLAIDRLKIDRAFVSTTTDETVNRPVLDSIIQLADRLTLPTIAEGIETRAQLDYLAACGVQFGQGYLIGRPMSIEAFRDWLTRHNTGTPPSLAIQVPTVAGADPRPDKVAQRMWNAMRVPAVSTCEIGCSICRRIQSV